MAVSIEIIKELRELTSASVSDCKKALDDAKGDIKKASELIRQRGLEIATKKASRAANQGRIEAYVHTGSKIGVMVEINCETDFVARNEGFIRFCKDIAMQVAATDPEALRREDIPAEEIKDLNDAQKEDFFKVRVLLDQPFIKDPKQSIKDYLTATVAKIGENIVIRRYSRFKLGEDEK
ncbi:MAG: translation elongation factor Ts [Candidatus Omnitrophica bacterium]|nr:translation elongation factor Ts [Candidatus Omnitrophota bacterium]MDD5573728.1 translation elongation factor Ts [Candidatus Omnitrophota bacterium]